ncbi:hypothetical protein ACIBFB_24635 [Nocardiopsis sp. NPDC050513]|uniref:TPR repeat region-containing protein n=1 Tax=Nocardiopsis sp. NPDC050513 TaxID=3364338 RepID=UPI0037A9D27F
MSQLSYNECEIDTGVLGQRRDAFDEIHAKISGRSGEFNTIAEPVGFHFDNLIGESLRGVAVENRESWSSAMVACQHAYGLIGKAIEDVKWYEDEIEAIKSRLQSALSGLSTGDEEDDQSLRDAFVSQYSQEATEAWEELERRCEATEERLRGGPTPETIRELSEAGHIGANITYYTTGDVEYFSYDETAGITLANNIKDAVENGYGAALEALDGNIELLNLLIARGVQAQRNGESLSEGEIDFLEAVFDELGIEENRAQQMHGGSTPRDFTDFLAALNGSEYISDETRSLLEENLSGSMLLLSDENVGGGYDRLPEDVRDIIEGPLETEYDGTGDDFNVIGEWGRGINALADFLGSADSDLHGGTEFSATTTATFGLLLDSHDDSMTVGTLLDESESAIGRLLEIAMRNEEGNYAVIVGETTYPNIEVFEHPVHGTVDLESVLRGLYTYRWEDGGEAVTGLTDWISDYEMSGDPSQDRMATRAAFEVITTMAGEPLRTDLANTGQDVEDSVDPAFTEYNNYLASSLARLYTVNIDDFSIFPGPGASEEDRWGLMSRADLERNPLHENGDVALFLTDDTKRDFLQLLLANEVIAPQIIGATSAYETEIMGFALTGADEWDSDWSEYEGPIAEDAAELGRRSGRLSDVMNEALVQELYDRNLDEDEAQRQLVQTLMTGYEIAKIAIPEGMPGNGGPGAIANIAMELGKGPVMNEFAQYAEERIQDDYAGGEARSWLPEDRAENIRMARLQALNFAVEHGYISESQLHEELPVNGELPRNPGAWGEASESMDSHMIRLLSGIEEGALPNSQDVEQAREINPFGEDLLATVDAYAEGYADTHGDISELFRRAEEVASDRADEAAGRENETDDSED